MKKLLLFILLFTLIGCSTYTAEQKNTEKTLLSGKIMTKEALLWDFGSVDIKTPFIEQSFSFTNESTDPLTIFAVNSSCGCTAGSIVMGEEKSDFFSMDNPLETPIIIPPHASFRVNVQYEPGYHGPDLIGERNQTLYFASSSEQNKSTPTRIYPFDGESALTEIKLIGNIIKDES